MPKFGVDSEQLTLAAWLPTVGLPAPLCARIYALLVLAPNRLPRAPATGFETQGEHRAPCCAQLPSQRVKVWFSIFFRCPLPCFVAFRLRWVSLKASTRRVR